MEDSPAIRELVNRPIPDVLWHYTSLSGLLGIVENKSLWATDIRFLNDREEYLHALNLIDNAAKEISNESVKSLLLGVIHEACESGALSPTHMQVFVISFSAAKDLLSQWRAYTEALKGISLGFNLTTIRPPEDIGSMVTFAPCVYKAEEKLSLIRSVMNHLLEETAQIDADNDRRIKEAIASVHKEAINSVDKTADTEKIRQIRDALIAEVHADVGQRLNQAAQATVRDLARIMPLLKHASFEEECEWRLVLPLHPEKVPTNTRRMFRIGHSSLVPYLEWKTNGDDSPARLTHVLVGPNPDIERAQEAVKSLLLSNELKNVVIDKSDIPFRSW